MDIKKVLNKHLRDISIEDWNHNSENMSWEEWVDEAIEMLDEMSDNESSYYKVYKFKEAKLLYDMGITNRDTIVNILKSFYSEEKNNINNELSNRENSKEINKEKGNN